MLRCLRMKFTNMKIVNSEPSVLRNVLQVFLIACSLVLFFPSLGYAQSFKAGDKVEGFDNGKWYNATILEKKNNGYLVHWDGFSSTYDAIITGEKIRKKTGTASNEAEGSASKMRGSLPDLPGTWWALKSMTKKGEAVKEYGTLPTMDFCKSGRWTLGHGRTNEGGKYQISGSRIIFRYEDGSLWGNYTMRWNGETGILELTDGSYTIRMIYKNKLNNC